MILTYSGKSKLGARSIRDEAYDIDIVRSSQGDVNWGRRVANTQLNPDITNSVNKRVMRELFAEHGVPMPKLISRGEAVPYDGDGRLLQPLVGRPDYHMKGRGFWRIRTIHDLNKALRGTRRKAAATHFMEYIEAPREYRVHIFLGKSIRVSEKAHTAFHKYTTIKPTHNIKHVRRAAKQAINAVGLDFGAVDILANDQECWVLECNASPGLGGSMPALYARKFEEFYGK